MEMTTEEPDEKMALEIVRVESLKKKINAGSWNDHLEDLMKAWGEKAAGNRELHDMAASKWKGFSEKLYIPMIMLSTIAGVTNFGAASSDNSEYWMYCIGVINIITSLIASVVKHYKPDEKAQLHRSVAKSFGSYYRMMTLELGTPRGDRMSPEEITKWAKTEYDKLLKDAPNIPGEIIKDFKERHKHTENLPDIALSSYSIKIHGRPDYLPTSEQVVSHHIGVDE